MATTPPGLNLLVLPPFYLLQYPTRSSNAELCWENISMRLPPAPLPPLVRKATVITVGREDALLRALNKPDQNTDAGKHSISLPSPSASEPSDSPSEIKANTKRLCGGKKIQREGKATRRMTHKQNEADSHGRELSSIYLFKANARWGIFHIFRGEKRCFLQHTNLPHVARKCHHEGNE